MIIDYSIKFKMKLQIFRCNDLTQNKLLSLLLSNLSFLWVPGAVEMRWVDTYFPFTEPSFELEIYFKVFFFPSYTSRIRILALH